MIGYINQRQLADDFNQNLKHNGDYNMSTNAVDQAIAAAKEAAAKTPTGTTVDLVASTSSNGVQSYAPVQAPSLDMMASGPSSVDAYLKVKFDGLKIGDKPGLIDSIRVAIDMSPSAGEMVAANAVKYGDPAVYLKSYDGINCTTGGTWAEAIQKAKLIDPKANPYMSCDIAMTLIEDAKDLKGQVASPAGTRLGHSTSTTNRANAAELIRAVKEAGLSDEVVEVIVTAQQRTNPKGQEWGVLKFQLVGAYAPSE